MMRLGLILALFVAMHAHLSMHEAVILVTQQLEDAHRGEDHDHPTVRPAVPATTSQAMVTVTEILATAPEHRTIRFRDSVALSALRIDHDVGLYALNDTYLI